MKKPNLDIVENELKKKTEKREKKKKPKMRVHSASVKEIGRIIIKKSK